MRCATRKEGEGARPLVEKFVAGTPGAMGGRGFGTLQVVGMGV